MMMLVDSRRGGGALGAGFSDDSSLIVEGVVDHWGKEVVMIAG